MLSLQWLKERKRWVYLIFVLIILSLLAVIIYIYVLLNMKSFYKGISIENIDISGLDIQQASEHITNIIDKRYENWSLLLEYDDNAWIINCDDIELRIKKNDALEKAYKIGRTGNLRKRIEQIFRVRSNSINIEIEREYNREKLKNILLNIKENIDREKKNSSVLYDEANNTVVVNNHLTGRELMVEENIRLIEKNIYEKSDEKLKLIVEEKMPDIAYDSIKEIKYVTSSFSTNFNLNDTNRAHNIKLACEKISGTIIMPGEIFSMNFALGERTEENGYKEAPVILRNKFVPEIGGGICQVTTTLYIAAVKAGIEIIERKPHSMPLGYVKPGQDATIAGNVIDLKFRNNLGYPICLWAFVKGNILNIKLLGNRNEEDYTVELKSEIIKVYEPEEEEVIVDDSLEDGIIVVEQEARKGLKVIVYKEVYSKTGELLNKEKVSDDTYWPVRGIIKVNSNYFLEKDIEADIEADVDERINN